MYAKQALGDLRRVQRSVQTKMDRVEELEAICNRVTTQLSDMPRGSHDPHRREAVLTQLIDLKDDLMDEVQDLIDEERFARIIIESIEDKDQRDIIERHYINGEDWISISDIYGLTVRQIYRLRDKALQSADAKL